MEAPTRYKSQKYQHIKKTGQRKKNNFVFVPPIEYAELLIFNKYPIGLFHSTHCELKNHKRQSTGVTNNNNNGSVVVQPSLILLFTHLLFTTVKNYLLNK